MNTATFKENSFLQSCEWEEVQKCYGRRTLRLSAGGRNILCIKNDMRLGMYYWYAPRPHIQDLNRFLEAVAPLAKEGLFFRTEPVNELGIANHESRIMTHDSPPPAEKLIIRKARNLQPRETILVNLLQSEDELLAAMHPKTRYNIRVAERYGVVIKQRAGGDAITDFYGLLQRTSRRDNFSLHPKRYYECLLKTSLHSQVCENVLFFALCEGSVAAAAMVNFYKGTATYLHGASDYEFRSTMAPYALQWYIINEAKQRGFNIYDLGGVDETRWPGVTRFKKGFGGFAYAFPQAFGVFTSQPKRILYDGLRIADKVYKFLFFEPAPHL